MLLNHLSRRVSLIQFVDSALSEGFALAGIPNLQKSESKALFKTNNTVLAAGLLSGATMGMMQVISALDKDHASVKWTSGFMLTSLVLSCGSIIMSLLDAHWVVSDAYVSV